MLLENYPVCIDCKYKVDVGQWMAFAQHAAMLNFASQLMDDVVEMGFRSAQVEIPKPPVPPISYSNHTISVSGGTVGSINFGNVREIQVNLQALTERGAQDIVGPLGKPTDAILNANDADQSVRNELLEQVAALTTIATAEPGKRKHGTAKALFAAIKEGAGAIGSAAGAWGAVEPLLRGHFGL